MNWYFAALKKYAVFGGRALRREYWVFQLANVAIWFALGLFEGPGDEARVCGESLVRLCFRAALLLPSIAVGVRRMHDTDHTGWWVLVPVANLILAVSRGAQGENRFGPAPKAL
jgi:uncharacterized membrane protein YhaH (DUF805 family)